MNNLVYLIGRLTEDPEIKKYEDGKSMLNITLGIQRSYKNQDGVYDVDFIRCCLWNEMANHTSEYCKKGDLVGVKGKIQNRSYVDENGEKKYITEIIADKISFLASKKVKDEIDSDNDTNNDKDMER